MQYSVILVTHDTKLNETIREYIQDIGQTFHLILQTAIATEAASIMKDFPIQIAIVQDWISFYNAGAFIHDSKLKNMPTRFILLKDMNLHTTVSGEDMDRVSKILEIDHIDRASLHDALQKAADDYEQAAKVIPSEGTVSCEWQTWYMNWLQQSSLIAGLLTDSLTNSPVSRADLHLKGPYYVLVIGEISDTTANWNFYNQSAELLGSLYYRLTSLLDRHGGTVFITGERKLCFMVSIEKDTYQQAVTNFCYETVNILTGTGIPSMQFSASGPESGFQHLYQLFREVDRTLPYHFFTTPYTLITGEWLKKNSIPLDLNDFNAQIDIIMLSFDTKNEAAMSTALVKIQEMVTASLSFNSYTYAWGYLSFMYFSQARKHNLVPDMDFSAISSRDFDNISQAFNTIITKITQLFKSIPDKVPRSTNVHIHQAAEYIMSNISDDFSLSGVADAIHLSPNYLSHLFKEEYGMTFVEYVHEVRIRRAAELLKDGRKIEDAARQAGFTDGKYFSKIFKKIMGTTPREYQRSMLKE